MNGEWDAGTLAPASWTERNPNLIPTKAIVLIETIDGTGSTGFHHLVSDHCPEWAELGMLHAAVEQCRLVWESCNLDDGDV